MPLSEAVRTFLMEPHFGVLATVNADGLPQQTVVWYELQGDEVLMNTRYGRLKDRNLRRDPRVSLCVADGYRYVTLTGTARLKEDQEAAQADIMHLAVRYHGPERGAENAKQYRGQRRVTIRMSIERVLVYGIDEG